MINTRYRIKFKGIIALLLVSSVPVKKAYAGIQETNSDTDVLNGIQNEAEEVLEAYSDAKSKVSAGNWWLAIMWDRLSRNTFHNAVQDDIIAKSKGEISKEQKVFFVDENGKRQICKK